MSASTITANFSNTVSPLSPASLRQIICDEVVDACACLGGLEAIILTGSMARDEASITTDHHMTVVLGDAEFLLIFAKTVRVPAAHSVEKVAKNVESRLNRRSVKCRICLSPVSTAFLDGMVPHIFAYELRHCGRIVWGDQTALTCVPPFETTQIPLDDAVRLLCNRMVELLEIMAVSGLRSKATKYATVKLYLDMATSFLVFAGAYRPTYRERLKELQKMAAATRPGSAPFPLQSFTQVIEYCTRLKLSTSDSLSDGFLSDPEESEHWLMDGIQLAHLLWRWELQRLLRLDAKTSDEELLARWAASQPWPARLRGWLRVLRDGEGTTARRHWKRWLRIARHRSPRHAVYTAACRLFFLIPDVRHIRSSESIKPLRNLLPISPEGDAGLTWPALASSIAQNYHQFLEFTRT